MSGSVTLSCSTCGNKLSITSDIEHFACSQCGTELIARHEGGIVSISPTSSQGESSNLPEHKFEANRSSRGITTNDTEMNASSPPWKFIGCGSCLLVVLVDYRFPSQKHCPLQWRCFWSDASGKNRYSYASVKN